jgi:hypothetical protein
MSGGGGGTNSTKQELPEYAQPYAQEILSRGAELSRQPMPQYSGPLVAGLTGGQQSAIGGINGLASKQDPLLAGARSSMTDMTGANPYMTRNRFIGQPTPQNPYATMDNPYLNQQVGKAQGDLVNQYTNATAPQTMAQFRNAGAFGGSAMAQTQDMQNRQLVNGLNDVSATMRGNAYAGTQQAAGQQAALDLQGNIANMQGQQNQNALNSQNHQWGMQNRLMASSMAPALNDAQYSGLLKQLAAGEIEQKANQNQVTADYQKWQQGAYAPYQQLGILSSALSGALGNGAQGVTTTSMSGGAPWMNMGGGAMGLMGAMMSMR